MCNEQREFFIAAIIWKLFSISKKFDINLVLPHQITPTNRNNLKGCSIYLKFFFFVYFSPHFFSFEVCFFTFASFCNILCLCLVKIHCTTSQQLVHLLTKLWLQTKTFSYPKWLHLQYRAFWSICKPEAAG